MRLFGFTPEMDPFEGFFRLHTRAAFPPVNVFVDPEGWVVRLEIPGVGPENLVVESHARTLEVSGKREESAPTEGSFLRRERWTGEFARSIQLPAISRISARNSSVSRIGARPGSSRTAMNRSMPRSAAARNAATAATASPCCAARRAARKAAVPPSG